MQKQRIHRFLYPLSLSLKLEANELPCGENISQKISEKFSEFIVRIAIIRESF